MCGLFGFSGFCYSKNEYIDDLKTIGAYHGYTPEDIDRFLKSGFSPEEIENFIYEYWKIQTALQNNYVKGEDILYEVY